MGESDREAVKSKTRWVLQNVRRLRDEFQNAGPVFGSGRMR